MADKIKFRVWTKSGKYWLFNNGSKNDTSYGGKDAINLWCYKNSGLSVNSISSSDTVIQQFTSLKDSNNKEIYDGDIIEWTEYINWKAHIPYPTPNPTKYTGEIQLDLAAGCLVKPHYITNYLDVTIRLLDILKNSNVKVIGNICENKDLIK